MEASKPRPNPWAVRLEAILRLVHLAGGDPEAYRRALAAAKKIAAMSDDEVLAAGRRHEAPERHAAEGGFLRSLRG